MDKVEPERAWRRVEELNVLETKTVPQGGTCVVCGEQKALGIRIFAQFLCVECEREIVNTDVEDEKYPYYIERMKQIWLGAIS